MLRIETNDKSYEVCREWEDISLSKMIDLNRLISSYPNRLKDLYKGEDVELEEEYFEDFDNFRIKVVSLLSNIPQSVIEKTEKAELIALYNVLLSRFVAGCITFPDYRIEGISEFMHKGETYYLPECETDITGNPMPGVNISALEFTETTDLVNAGNEIENGQFGFAANVISILCRKKNEAYNEQACKERAKEFQDLGMNIVLEVFFCLDQCTTILSQNTRISTLRGNLQKK
jgi:hypothetical protein